jgi:hypothetical protein
MLPMPFMPSGSTKAGFFILAGMRSSLAGSGRLRGREIQARNRTVEPAGSSLGGPHTPATGPNPPTCLSPGRSVPAGSGWTSSASDAETRLLLPPTAGTVVAGAGGASAATAVSVSVSSPRAGRRLGVGTIPDSRTTAV